MNENANEVPRDDRSQQLPDGIPFDERVPTIQPFDEPKKQSTWVGAGILGLLVASVIALILPAINGGDRTGGATRSDRLKMEDRLQQVEAANRLHVESNCADR